MKMFRTKLVLIAFALQALMLLSVVALVYAVAYNGRTVVLEMTGYDPYDALRGRYLRLGSPIQSVVLEPGSIERYINASERDRFVYLVLDIDPDSGISSFSYASLDRPGKDVPYIKCRSQSMWTDGDKTLVDIKPRIDQYYLNEKTAGQLDQSVRWDTEILLSLKVWHGMYVIDGIEIDGQKY